MPLIQLLSEVYPEDHKSKQLEGDPVRDVYFLTSYSHASYAIVYNYPQIFWSDFIDEDSELAEQIGELLGGEPEYSDLYENYDKIGEDVIKKIIDFVEVNIHDYQTDLPHDFTSSALVFREILKDEWLVHLSDYAYDIMKEGFTKGVMDADQLALTTYMDDNIKEFGGFNFAYRQNDVSRHGRNRHEQKYGKEVVLFQVPKAILCDHYGDQEPQVIFWGSNAYNITYFYIDYDEYLVQGIQWKDNKEKIIYEEMMDEHVELLDIISEIDTSELEK